MAELASCPSVQIPCQASPFKHWSLCFSHVSLSAQEGKWGGVGGLGHHTFPCQINEPLCAAEGAGGGPVMKEPLSLDC